VILSTYNQDRLFDRSLTGYERQSTDDFEVVIADDGSGPRTRELIEAHSTSFPVRLHHVWQEDKGFRKALILNRAVLESQGERLIFTDGDCIPSRTFVEEHLEEANRGHWVVGGHVRLNEARTDAITSADVREGRVDRMASLPEALALWFVHLKSLGYIAARKRRKPKLLGLNFSVDRDVFYAVNGFDMTFENSAKDDSDFRNRLQLASIPARSLWHRARVFHQHHPGHATRIQWKGAHDYYNRPDLSPQAERGLRELQAAD